MSINENITSRTIENSVRKTLKNYPGGIPSRLLNECEIVENEEPPVQINGPIIALLLPADPDLEPAIKAFINTVAQKGLMLQTSQYLILNASDFSRDFEKYSSIKFIIAFGLSIYNQLYAGQNLSSAQSLNDYRGIGMLIADQAGEIMSNPAKKKVFWENLKSNVIDKKII